MTRATRAHPPEVLRSMELLLALWDELREQPGPFHFELRGSSMWPTAPAGSLLAVTPCPANNLAPGDLVTFRRANTVVTHRVISVGAGDRVVAWGDSLLRPDPPIPASDVLGAATVVRRAPAVVVRRWARGDEGGAPSLPAHWTAWVAARWAAASVARMGSRAFAGARRRGR